MLGINHLGDPHKYSYPIYPASLGGDVWGIRRLEPLLNAVQPDAVCVLNDPWVIRDYMPILEGYKKNNPTVKLFGYTPVDSPNMRADFTQTLNGLDTLICYTEFGVNELRKSGLTTKTAVIPHGNDARIFYHIPKEAARHSLNNIPNDWYIVGCTNRN